MKERVAGIRFLLQNGHLSNLVTHVSYCAKISMNLFPGMCISQKSAKQRFTCHIESYRLNHKTSTASMERAFHVSIQIVTPNLFLICNVRT